MLTPRLHTTGLCDRPLANGARRRRSDLNFDAALEAEYARTQLTNSRTLILVTCIVASLLGILRGVEQVATHGLGSIDSLGLPFVIVSSLALTFIVWGAGFERLYPSWAQIIVPVRNAIVATHVATAASQGQLELLMIMPLAIIGPFFFLGFNYRAGLFCGVLTSAAFFVSAAALDFPLALAIRTSVFLAMSLIACAVIARHVDRWSRTLFLETRVNADLAQHDALTGTKNRRVFDEHLTMLWPQAIENGRSIAVMLIDVDHFKSYNDRYGHQAGDDALRRVVQAIETYASRPMDVLARYGGEEFAAVLYDVDQQQAMQVGERMLRAVEALNICHHSSGFGRVTISIGVAAVKPTRERNVQGVLQLADQALYEAKTSGRNRIKTMSDAEHRMLETGVFSRSVHATQNKD